MTPSATWLSAVIEAARQAHPDLSVTDDAFAAFVVRRIERGELDADLAARHADDLLLACAALAGEPAAIEEIDRRCIAILDPVVQGIVPTACIDEVKQRLRHLMFVPDPGQAAKIDSYAGRGPLRSWVRATAVRIALAVRRDSAAAAPDEAALLLGDPASPADDPAMRLLRDRYAGEFRSAFEAALRSVEPDDRTLLRQHFVDGIGTEDLARLHRVHRVTMFRRLGKVRNRLLRRTRRELAARVGAGASELDSIMRAVQSRIELTLERVLASES